MGPTGISVGYAPSVEKWVTVAIPCMFCYSCEKQFSQEWQSSKIKSIFPVLLLLLLIPVVALLILVTALVTFLALPGLIFIAFAMFRHANRKRGDKFILAHLSKLHNVPKLLAEDEYTLEWQPMRAITKG